MQPYRYQNQRWVAQVDDYPQGAPNLLYKGYVPGTNGLIYAPQGGLRASVLDLATLAMMLMNGGQYKNSRILSEESVAQMTTAQWTYNGNNGDTWDQFFQSYGLGVHILTNREAADVIYPEMNMLGHAGIAYGLLSDLYYDPRERSAVIFITNGCKNDYRKIKSSAFYEVEHEVFQICHLYLKDSILYRNYQ